MAARSVSGYPATRTGSRPGEWITYSPQQQALLLADLAARRNLELDRTRLGGYSRQMEHRLYQRAGTVAGLLCQRVRSPDNEASPPWRWAELSPQRQAERLLEVAAWARCGWPVPDYDAKTRLLFRELASAAAVMADRLYPRVRGFER